MIEKQANKAILYKEATVSSAEGTFLRQTYMHLAMAILGFVGLEMIFLKTPVIVEFGLKMAQGWTWLIVLGAFAFISNYFTKWTYQTHDVSKQYLGMFIYVALEALIFVPLLFIAQQTAGGQVIAQAAILTGGLFLGISYYAYTSDRDFSFLQKYLSIGFILAIALIVGGVLFGFNLGLWFSVAMVALAAGSIIYQTNGLRSRYQKDQYIAAATGLFASVMLLFWYVLRIVMAMDRD